MWGKTIKRKLLNWVKTPQRTVLRKSRLGLESLEDRSVPAATFLGLDSATQGNWSVGYGRDGQSIPGSAPVVPSYATVNLTGASVHTWKNPSQDDRILEGGSAATWRGFTFTIDVNVSDAQTHRIALYVLDWNRTGRTERIDVLDSATGQIYDSRLVSSFESGTYLVYSASSHVQFRMTAVTGSSAFLGGLFFGLPAVTSPPSATKSTPTLTITRPNGEYSGASFPASVTVAGTNGISGSLLEGVAPTLTYYSGSSATGQPLPGAPIASGTYTVLASFAGSASYTSATATKTFTIARATSQTAVTDAGGTYSTSTFPATASVAGVSGIFSATLDSTAPSLTYYSGTTATGGALTGTPSAAGTYTVVASFPGSTNYSSSSASTTFSIARATPAITLTDASATYDASVHAASATIAGVSGTPVTTLEGVGLTLTYYTGSVAVGTPLGSGPSQAGTYTVRAAFAGTPNYASAATTRTYTIARALPTQTVANSGGVYKGSAYATTYNLVGVNGTHGVTLEGVAPTLTYFAESPLAAAPSQAGTYSVVADFPGSTNYSAVRSIARFTISPASPTVRATANGGVFNGNNFAASVTVSGITGIAGQSLDGVTPTLEYYSGPSATGEVLSSVPKEVGTYTAVATYPGSTNYTPGSTNSTFSISPNSRFWMYDSSTKGDWSSNFGSDGYALAGLSTTSFPGYAEVTISGTSSVWSDSTTDIRALKNGASRFAGAWSGGSVIIDIKLTDGQAHSVALYALDWNNVGMVEFIEFADVTSGNILDSRTISSLSGGQYVAYNIVGHVQFRINTQYDGPAAISGLFFGDAYEGAPPPSPPPPSSPPPPNSPPAPPVQPGVTVTSEWITTPYDKIPNFGGHPTLEAVASGNWSNPTTWGGRLPAANEIVAIGSGIVVTYDQVSDVKFKTVSIESGGRLQFRTTADTRLRVTNLLVLPGGTLTVGTTNAPVPAGVRAEIIINDVPIDTSVDPEQYGNGLLAFGTVRMAGATQTLGSVTLAVEPRAGNTTLVTATPVTGWSVGDRVVVPDTRQLDDESSSAAHYVNQLERPTIVGISADGRTITLSSPLVYDHLGVRDLDGVLTFLPDIANLNRNVVIKSESARSTRGHTMFSQRADVDIRYVQFSGLGRSTTDYWDNTVFNSDGEVSHIGTNQKGRYPVSFRHLIGPESPQSNGQQFTFIGNSVFCPIIDMKFRWGIALEDAQFGLIEGNVVYNWAGGGIVGEDGASAHNRVVDNYIANIFGAFGRTDSRGLGDLAFEGAGVWFRSGLNEISQNTVVDSTYGYLIYSFVATSVRLPAAQGQDPLISGQFRYVDMTNVPLQFVGNSVYGGMTVQGLELWSVGTNWIGAHSDAQESVVRDFHVWNVLEHAYFGYETNRVTFDGFVFRADTASLYARNYAITAIYSGDYFQKDFTIRHSDIQGAGLGWYPSTITGGGFQIIENTYMRNYTNIAMVHLWTSAYSVSTIDTPREVIVRNVRFGQIPNVSDYNLRTMGPQSNIKMVDAPVASTTDYTKVDRLFVYDYNGQSGNNFQVFYNGQAAIAILPQDILNADGSKQVAGAPTAGLTNAAAWATFGIAIAGAVAPVSATHLDYIVGLVEPI